MDDDVRGSANSARRANRANIDGNGERTLGPTLHSNSYAPFPPTRIDYEGTPPRRPKESLMLETLDLIAFASFLFLWFHQPTHPPRRRLHTRELSKQFLPSILSTPKSSIKAWIDISINFHNHLAMITLTQRKAVPLTRAPPSQHEPSLV